MRSRKSLERTKAMMRWPATWDFKVALILGSSSLRVERVEVSKTVRDVFQYAAALRPLAVPWTHFGYAQLPWCHFSRCRSIHQYSCRPFGPHLAISALLFTELINVNIRMHRGAVCS